MAIKKRRKGAGRAAFFAHLEEIQERLAKHEPQIVIYEDMQEKLGIGYPQFSLYCRRFVTTGQPHHHPQPTVKTAPTPLSSSEKQPLSTSNKPAQRVSTKRKTPFDYDPVPPPKEDLM